ncbi:hypothetical protein A2U01_0102071, partial [Trifolium medium]|nr:hypothetical protein [Trifolium medium]
TAAGGGVIEATQSSPKKRKTFVVHKGRTMALPSGSTAPVSDLEGGDKNILAADVGLGVIQPSSSQTAPAATSSA